MPSATKKPSLTFVTLALMVAVALLFDGGIAAAKFLDMIPAIGNAASLIASALVSVFAYLTFWFWFQRHGVTFIKSPKRLLTFPVAFFIKLVPFLGALPAWTAAVVFIFLNVRAEDLLTKTELGAKVVGKAANVAGKLGADKQKMKEVAEKAKEVEQGAREAQERLQKEKTEQAKGKEEQSPLGAGVDTGEGTVAQRQLGQGSPTAQTPSGGAGTPPAGTQNTRKPEGDIGAQPVFRQTPQTQNTQKQGGGVHPAFQQRQKEVLDDHMKQQGFGRPMEGSRERTPEEKAKRQKEVRDEYRKEHGFAQPMEGKDTLPKTEEGQRKRAEAKAERQKEMEEDMAKRGEQIL